MKSKIICKLQKRSKKYSGRNNQGLICVRHRGGGKKKFAFTIIDYRRNLLYVPSIVLSITNNFKYRQLAKLCYINGVISYIINIIGLKLFDMLLAGEFISLNKGNNTSLINFPISFLIHNIQLHYNQPAKLVRSAGMYAKIVKKTKNKYIIFKINKKLLFVHASLYATIGRISNQKHKMIKYKKAGELRLMNKRPSVRGVAMNPIDHPHGGGQGKTSGGRCSVSPWGFLTKGKKTLYKLKRVKKKIKLTQLFKY